MNIKDYLKVNNIKPKDFAERIGVTVHSLNSWIYRGVIPRKDAVRKVEEATLGLVTYHDFGKPSNADTATVQ